MLEYFRLWLWVLGLLMVYLCISVGLHWLTEARERRRRWRGVEGKGFDVSAIAPQVRRVHEEPLAALKARRQPRSYRDGLLAAARRLISQLSFFDHAKSSGRPAKHDLHDFSQRIL
jgi:hypothetical protein